MYYRTDNPHGGDIYDPTEPVVLDFSASVNPLGTPEAVLSAAHTSLRETWRYPDPFCRELTAAIAAREGVPCSRVLCGNGASELIYAWCAAARPRSAAETAPCFTEYARALGRVGCVPERYAPDPDRDFLPDTGLLDFLREKRPDALFLCDPNNPTGRRFPPELLHQVLVLCREQGTRVFLDRCFIELSDGWDDPSPDCGEFPNLTVLGAFTKSHGMAGLRLGWCVSGEEALLRDMAEACPPWNVSSVAQAAGIAAARDREFPRLARDLIRRERPAFRASLEALGFRVIPSETNFLLFRGPAELAPKLRGRGIGLRDCANFPGLAPGWYRAAVRKHGEWKALMQAIKEELWRETS